MIQVYKYISNNNLKRTKIKLYYFSNVDRLYTVYTYIVIKIQVQLQLFTDGHLSICNFF